MLLDRLLLQKIHIIIKKMMKDSKFSKLPQNIDEMYNFLKILKYNIETNTFEGALISNILFFFVSDKRIRDRKVTSRIFEDIFSSFFSLEPTDEKKRSNPPVPEKILALDELCKNENWKISSDLSGNKREKSDVILKNYRISLKTLKGKVVELDGKISDKKLNKELNIGSFSYRALLKGILSDKQIEKLSDRKGGLGSGKQLRKNVFDIIVKEKKETEFLTRLSLFLNYVYEEDIYIILKSHYKMYFYLIPNKTFINAFILKYQNDEPNFHKLFYRWENNNLRINWPILLSTIDKFKEKYNFIPYYSIDFNLGKSINNKEFKEFITNIGDNIERYFNKE